MTDLVSVSFLIYRIAIEGNRHVRKIENIFGTYLFFKNIKKMVAGANYDISGTSFCAGHIH